MSFYSKELHHTPPAMRLYYLLHFYIETKTSNCITSGEIYDKIKDCGFSDVIKVDGGGSFYCKINGEIQKSTSENRQINNIGVVM